MKQRVWAGSSLAIATRVIATRAIVTRVIVIRAVATLAIAALAMLSGCAEILGLEPGIAGAGGTGAGATGGTAGSATGGTGTTSGPECTFDADCPAGGLPDCQKPVCVEGKCQSTAAQDGEEIPCYEGPAMTEGVGICKAGVTTCVGGVQGPCNGSSLPEDKDDCQSPGDEDCDGTEELCGGAIIDVQLSAGMGVNDLRGVAVDAAGNVFITGSHASTASVFGCMAPVIGINGGFLAKLTPDLTCVWIAVISSDTGAADLGAIVLAADHVWVTGSFSGVATIRDAVLQQWATGGAGLSDAVLFGFDSSSGALFDGYTIGGAGDDYGVAIAAGAAVFALVQGGAGQIASIVSGATDPYPGSGGDPNDAIVVALAPQTAKVLWIQAFGSTSSDAPRSLAVLGDRLFIGGGIGAGAMTQPACAVHMDPSPRAFLFDTDAATGLEAPKTCELWGGTGPSYAVGIASGGVDQVLTAGFSDGSTNLGCVVAGGGGTNGWFRRSFEGNGCADAKILDGPSSAFGVRALPLDTDLIFAGNYVGILEGVTSSNRDLFLHRYFFDGSRHLLQWHLEVGSTGDDDFSDLAVSPVDSTIVVVGKCRGTSFGGKDCDGDGDGFVLRVAP